MRSTMQIKMTRKQKKAIAFVVSLCFISVFLFSGVLLVHDDHGEYGHGAVECAACVLIHDLKQAVIDAHDAQLAISFLAIAVLLSCSALILTGFWTPIKMKVRINN